MQNIISKTGQAPPQGSGLQQLLQQLIKPKAGGDPTSRKIWAGGGPENVRLKDKSYWMGPMGVNELSGAGNPNNPNAQFFQSGPQNVMGISSLRKSIPKPSVPGQPGAQVNKPAPQVNTPKSPVQDNQQGVMDALKSIVKPQKHQIGGVQPQNGYEALGIQKPPHNPNAVKPTMYSGNQMPQQAPGPNVPTGGMGGIGGVGSPVLNQGGNAMVPNKTANQPNISPEIMEKIKALLAGSGIS